jgi:hypothetical protein
MRPGIHLLAIKRGPNENRVGLYLKKLLERVWSVPSQQTADVHLVSFNQITHIGRCLTPTVFIVNLTSSEISGDLVIQSSVVNTQDSYLEVSRDFTRVCLSSRQKNQIVIVIIDNYEVGRLSPIQKVSLQSVCFKYADVFIRRLIDSYLEKRLQECTGEFSESDSYLNLVDLVSHTVINIWVENRPESIFILRKRLLRHEKESRTELLHLIPMIGLVIGLI